MKIMINDNDSKFLDHYSKLLSNLPPHLKVIKVDEDIHHVIPKNISHSKKIALVALTHGDEIIGLHIFIRLLEGLLEDKLTLDRELFLVLANRKAYLKKQRYVEADLNRSYGSNNNKTLESQRACSIKLIVDKCDYIIDIHQCIEDTLHPFFILPYSKEAYIWLTSVAPNVPIIIKNNVIKVTTLSSYGALTGKKAVTFEVGARGFDDDQLKFGFNSIKSFLRFAWQKDSKNQNRTVFNPTYEIKYFQPYSKGSVKFHRLFKNFDPVEEGQVIVYLNGDPIYTPITGKILLYPRKWFMKNSLVKADGLFFVLQESQLKI